VLWLERPPIWRWAAAVLLVAVAAWSEFAPPPSVTMTFLSADVPAGTPLTADLVERRLIPAPGFATIDPSGIAAVDLMAGDPLVASMVATVDIPHGWVHIAASLPDHAVPGTRAKGVILDQGEEPSQFPALVVAAGPDDPFGEGDGTIAVPPEWLGPAAAAAAAGRLVVGVEAGS
jgi:hypothetical protein